MADETQISTPVETPVEVTSENSAPETAGSEETADTEPETITAENETNSSENTLYAGKYKSVEELEKGYNEAQKFVSKAADFEKKYNDLIEKQNQETQKAQEDKLRQAQTRGFSSVEQQEIADKVTIAEFEYYANNINLVDPENMEDARQNLLQYYNTANRAYLDAAKRYYSSDFIENAAIAKTNLERQLTAQLAAGQNAQKDKQAQALAEVLKADYAEFLADIDTNEGKAEALKSFCYAGTINSKEDMQTFLDIYNKVAKYEREQAIKEYEAQKAIDETKNASQINSETNNPIPADKASYTDKEIGKMSMEQFNKIVDERGLEAFIN